MAGNTTGTLFRVTSFGESHGVLIGGVIDGCPAGIEIETDFIQQELNKRRPGQSHLTSARNEKDEVVFLSGIFEGKSLGTPIAFHILNESHQSANYDHLKDVFRPSHADYTYYKKYGIRDHRGGGRSSARETAVRIVAGSVARLVLKKTGILICAFVSQVGPHTLQKPIKELDLSLIESNAVRCPDPDAASVFTDYIEKIKKDGDTTGGCVTGLIKNVPPGLGEPVFDKLNADLGKAMLSINAAKAFGLGEGFGAASMKGSEYNDAFINDHGNIRTTSNHDGGIQGGISNGEDIVFQVAFKPVPTIMQKQKSVDKAGKKIEFEASGHHDPCVLPRVVPVVEAMAALVVLDFVMRNNGGR